jgi:hypothetical protein
MVGFRVTEDALGASVVRSARLVFMPDGKTDHFNRPVTKLTRKLLDSIGDLISELRQDFLIMELSGIVLIGYKCWF